MSDKDFPAFPGRAYSGLPNDGMTLRDYFAAKAMQSMVIVPHEASDWNDFEMVAGSAYAQADAMMKARTA